MQRHVHSLGRSRFSDVSFVWSKNNRTVGFLHIERTDVEETKFLTTELLLNMCLTLLLLLFQTVREAHGAALTDLLTVWANDHPSKTKDFNQFKQ